MARITTAELLQIIPNNADTPTLESFIAIANEMVNTELGGSSLSEDRKKSIELYLAAHFAVVTVEKGGIMQRKIGDAQDTYQSYNSRNAATLGLVATRYGQQVLFLDTTGKFAAISTKPVKAQFKVYSTPPDREIADLD